MEAWALKPKPQDSGVGASGFIFSSCRLAEASGCTGRLLLDGFRVLGFWVLLLRAVYCLKVLGSGI